MAIVPVVHHHQIENHLIDDIIIIIVGMIIHLDHVLVVEVGQDLDVVTVDVEVLVMHMINSAT
jgi:hypothetical protein